MKNIEKVHAYWHFFRVNNDYDLKIKRTFYLPFLTQKVLILGNKALFKFWWHVSIY